MITKFNLYESINDGKPKMNDYVIVTFRDNIIPNIGRITYIKHDTSFPYLVIFGNDFNFYEYGLEDNTMVVDINEIIYWSKNKKELETLIQANKYNL